MAIDLIDSAELWLIRHAESVGNRDDRYQGHEDMPLTELGQRQSLALARRLHREVQTWPVTAIYSSDLSRSLDTARPTAEALALPIRIERRLREIDVGGWSGLTYAEIADEWPEQWKSSRSEMDPTIARGGGESYIQAQQRIVSVVTDLVQCHANERILIFFHGGVLRALLVHLLGMSLRNLRRFVTDNTSIHRLRVGRSAVDGSLEGVIFGLNDIYHLSDMHAQQANLDGAQSSSVDAPE